jgi:hypothetical protein
MIGSLSASYLTTTSILQDKARAGLHTPFWSANCPNRDTKPLLSHQRLLRSVIHLFVCGFLIIHLIAGSVAAISLSS